MKRKYIKSNFRDFFFEICNEWSDKTMIMRLYEPYHETTLWTTKRQLSLHMRAWLPSVNKVSRGDNYAHCTISCKTFWFTTLGYSWRKLEYCVHFEELTLYEPAHEIMVLYGVSPEPSLFAYMNYGSRRRVKPKIRHLASLDGCACVFEEWIYGGQKVP